MCTVKDEIEQVHTVHIIVHVCPCVINLCASMWGIHKPAVVVCIPSPLFALCVSDLLP